MQVYEKYPEFINTDPRIYRPALYRITSEFTSQRHECLFNDISLLGKTVLDLGSCVGSTGAWALENGCKFYCGVEYSKDLADISESNFSKYFRTEKYKIVNSSVESFFETNTQKFDIIIAGGIVHAYYDPLPFLTKLTEIADTVIIEEYHPYTPLLKHQMSAALSNHPLWEKFIETDSFIQYIRVPMIWGADKQNIMYNGSLPSLGFLIFHMNIFGFEYDGSLDYQLKERIPHIYNIHNRYGARFFRNPGKQKQSTGLITAKDSEDSRIIPWDPI